MTRLAVNEVYGERMAQDRQWGEQNHPDGTGRIGADVVADRAKTLTDAHEKAGIVTWQDILDEEVAEAFAETLPGKLRTELIQVAAVAVAWVEAIDRRDTAPEGHPT